ncbi:MAG TPA: hypothetical protein VNJ03_05430 [Vicinamibacterales bacterium]|nr:hypothetical protein [Vicinamibacterales bacterium]
MRRTLSGILMLAAIISAGCDNTVENATPPTTPVPTVTETFTGNVNINGGSTHTFTATAAGSVTATLFGVTPVNTVTVGFSIGTWNALSGSCQSVIAKDDSVQGTVLTGNASAAGMLCARIYDVGKLTETIGYTITVTRP